MNCRRCLSSFVIAPGAALIAFALGGCPILPNNPGDPNTTPSTQARLRPFNSAEELLGYFRAQALVRSNGGTGLRTLYSPSAAPATGGAEATADAAGNSTGGADSGATSTSFSTTNIQEFGVDESDLFKSDGTNFYIAKGNSLRIVRANPASELTEIGRLNLEGQIDSLYLSGGKALVLEQRYTGAASGPFYPAVDILIWPPYYAATQLVVSEIDVSNPANPQISRQIKLDGTLATSRLTGNRLVLIMTIVPTLPANPTRTALNRLTLENILPKAVAGGAETMAVDWPNVYRPLDPNGYYMTAVVALDAADIQKIVSSTAIMADAGTIYASPSALYVTDTNYDISSATRQTTAVHKFKLDDNGAAYVASGTVAGRLLNQFSLSESHDVLRVASHVDNFQITVGRFPENIPFTNVDSAPGAGAGDIVAPSQPFNAIYTLAQTGDALNVKGALENIAPGEQLYAARFLDQRGFLITFRRIDPLFVIDLSDPARPALLGQLEVPGYSEYLHPLDATTLIGVGRSIDNRFGFAEPGALQLSLFDVSDVAHPRLVQHVEVGGFGSYSDVSNTHKAFTLLPDRGILAIPALLYRDTTTIYGGDLQFDGVLCYHVSPTDGFSELGRVANVGTNDVSYYYYYYASWRRAAIIDNNVYAVGPYGVRAAALDNFNTTHEVTLAPNPDENVPADGSTGGATDGGSGRPR